MVRIVFLNSLDDALFCSFIDLGDEIIDALVAHIDLIEVFELADRDFSGATGGLDGCIQKGLHRMIRLGAMRVGGIVRAELPVGNFIFDSRYWAGPGRKTLRYLASVLCCDGLPLINCCAVPAPCG